MPGLGFRAVGILERMDDAMDGADNLGLVGVMLLMLIMECILGVVVLAMEVRGVTLVMRVLGGFVGVVGSLVEVTDTNKAELGVNFKSGRGPDGYCVSSAPGSPCSYSYSSRQT